MGQPCGNLASALRVSDAVRKAGRHNVEVLDHLQKAMVQTVDGISARYRTPMLLSKARTIDILLWVDAAIAAGHRTRKPVELLKRQAVRLGAVQDRLDDAPGRAASADRPSEQGWAGFGAKNQDRGEEGLGPW